MTVQVTVGLGVWTESVETGALHKSVVLVAYQPSSYGAPLQVFLLVRGSVQGARSVCCPVVDCGLQQFGLFYETSVRTYGFLPCGVCTGFRKLDLGKTLPQSRLPHHLATYGRKVLVGSGQCFSNSSLGASYFIYLFLFFKRFYVCVHVYLCVCVRERKREREYKHNENENIKNTSIARLCSQCLYIRGVIVFNSLLSTIK